MSTTTHVHTATGSVHCFEAAGLGHAPYIFLRVVTRSSACEFCGTPIVFQFWLRSKEGFEFFVGSDCIYKSSDAGLKAIIDPIVAKHEKELRESRDKGYIEQFQMYLQKVNPDFFALDTRPHPWAYRASRGETYGDFNYQTYKYSGRTKKANLARQFLIGAGIIDPKTRKGRKQAEICKCGTAGDGGTTCPKCGGIKTGTVVVDAAKKRFKTWSMAA